MAVKTKPHPQAEVIKAWADGVPCEWRNFGMTYWKPLESDDPDPFCFDDCEYRIATKKVRFRNYLFWINSRKYAIGVHVDSSIKPDELEKRNYFIRWIGDWQETEAPNEG